MPRRSDRIAARRQCHISHVPNEVLALIFSCLPLRKSIDIPKLRLRLRPGDRDLELPQYRKVTHPQIIVLAWVSRQFRRVVHEHSFWQDKKFDLALPSLTLTATRITLGTSAREISVHAFFKSLPPFPNVKTLEIWPFKDDRHNADLTMIQRLFPGLKTLYTSEFPRYTGNLHDMVGLTDLMLNSYTGNDNLIPYGSSETLTQLVFQRTNIPSFHPKPETQLTRFSNIRSLGLFPIHRKLSDLLMPMPSKLTILRGSISELSSSDNHLFSPPCFQYLQELYLFFDPGNWATSPDRGRPFFESVVQQITSLRSLQVVELISGLFDPAWLRYFRNLRELRRLSWRPWRVYVGVERDELDPVPKFNKVMERMMREYFVEGTSFDAKPMVQIRIPGPSR